MALIVGATCLGGEAARLRVRAGDRQRVLHYVRRDDHIVAQVEAFTEYNSDPALSARLLRDIVAELENGEINAAAAPGLIDEIGQMENYGRIADTIAAAVRLGAAEKQRLLEIDSITDRLVWLLVLIETEESVLRIHKRDQVRARRRMLKIV